MPRVIFEHPSATSRVDVRVDMPDGGALGDACDEVTAPVPFSCRSANCGTCRVVVLEGASELLAPEDEELAILDLFAAPTTHRLACCAKMKPGLATLRVRPVNDDE